MKTIFTHTAIAVLATFVLTGPVNAAEAAAPNVSYDYAPVLAVEPILKTITVSTPREECWQEQVVYEVQDKRRNNAVGTVMGGVLGGAIGNAVGHKKSNKRVGAVVGAVLGATLGNAIASSDDQPAAGRRYASEERCRVYQDSHSEQRVVGYEVRYQYQDQTYTTVMDKDPGDTIRVRLAITPVS
jgi:uncharacterized protein YcfJ